MCYNFAQGKAIFVPEDEGTIESAAKSNTMKGRSMYYDRTMNPTLAHSLMVQYHWLVDYVRDHEDLDFQTGNDPNKNRSWFSVYRGTGRLLTIECMNNRSRIVADDTYKTIDTSFFDWPVDEDSFTRYLTAVSRSAVLGKYYMNERGEKKEGYFQTLVGRRYTIGLESDDDFVVFDKEFVLGFASAQERIDWNRTIVEEQNRRIAALRESYTGNLPREIGGTYGEVDLLGLNKDGDLVVVEIKQGASAKTALAPVQLGFYSRQLEKVLQEQADSFYGIVKKMVKQKVELGLIDWPAGREMPQRLSGRVHCLLVVGDDRFSPTIIKRYRAVKEQLLPDMKAYTCTVDGTLVRSVLEK